MKTIQVQTHKHCDFVNITTEIQNTITPKFTGIATIFVPHTTAGITIQECCDPDVLIDLSKQLDKIVPWENRYQHGEGNAAAHIKSSLLGSSTQILVHNGNLQLGTWQGVIFCEFDGPRTRKIWISENP